MRRIHRKVENWRSLYPELKHVTNKYLDMLPNCPVIPRRLKTVRTLRAFKKALCEALQQANPK
jgi:hypothetical protein